MLGIRIRKETGKIILKGGAARCECCCVIDMEKIRIPQQRECELIFGKLCGRCGNKPPPFSEFFGYSVCPDKNEEGKCIIWPTYDCATAIQSSGLLGEDVFNSPFPGRYRRSDACLRFYYRIVNEEESESGLVIKEGTISSGAVPLKSAIEEWLPYREDKPNLFEGEVCGMYIYKFNFKYWGSNCSGSEETGYRPGGAQPPCDRLTNYNVKMYEISQYGGFLEWDPKKCFD